jgi:hypothetical protein
MKVIPVVVVGILLSITFSVMTACSVMSPDHGEGGIVTPWGTGKFVWDNARGQKTTNAVPVGE